MASGELEPCGQMARQRDDGDIDVSPGEPGGDSPRRSHRPEQMVTRSNRSSTPLILQDVEEGEVRPVRPRPPEVPGPRKGECHGRRGMVAAGDDALGVVEARHDLAEGRDGRLDLLGVGLGVAVRFSMSIKISCRPALWAIRVFVM